MYNKKLPRFLSPERCEKLLSHVRPFKHYVMVKLMYSLGLRIHEVVSIRLQDIIEDRQELLITGKGSQERYLPVDEYEWSLIIDILQIYRPKKFLFENAWGMQYNTRQLRQFIYNAAQLSGVGHVHPHMLRHSRATAELNKGVNIFFIKQLLGHKNIETTAIYLSCATDGLRSVLYNKPILKS